MKIVINNNNNNNSNNNLYNQQQTGNQIQTQSIPTLNNNLNNRNSEERNINRENSNYKKRSIRGTTPPLNQHSFSSSSPTKKKKLSPPGSDDEDFSQRKTFNENQINSEENFELVLKKRGFIIKRMKEDGNCLFRAIADQIYGDQEMHDVVRKSCIAYMEAERDHFSQFITEDFKSYIERKRKNRCFGNNCEIQAMGELYNRPIEVYSYKAEPINIFHANYSGENPPLRLSYHNRNHYNSVVDPNAATIGVGLGLPSLKPGSADQDLLKKAYKASEDSELNDFLFNMQKNSTDWQQTEKEMEDAILAISRAEYYDQYPGNRKN